MSALGDAAGSFVHLVGGELAALSRRPTEDHTVDAVREVANIVGGVLAADGRLTDSELTAYLDELGPRLDPPLIVSTAAAREMHLFDGAAERLARPSVLFDLLVRGDARDGTRRAHTYYEAAMQVAHATAALDLVPSPDELGAIDSFRTALLRHLDAAGVSRPGQPVLATPPAPAATTATTATTAAAPPTASDPPPLRPVAELLAELDALIGLDNVKAEVRRLTSLLQVQQLRAERGLPVIDTSHHLVFTGNPGTGKTTVARLLSQVFHSVGVVSKGHLVETDRSHLVAGYVGQTALKTQQALESALGGMLLIDEAYALARGGEDDFGRQAIDTLVQFMEDHRDDLAIVAAGYPEEMADLIDANPGLKSRFTRTVNFPDYTDDELLRIFQLLGDRNRYSLSDDALARLRHLIAVEPRTRGFGNARFVRNLFETAIAHQATRLAPLTDPSDEQLTTLTADDIAPVDA